MQKIIKRYICVIVILTAMTGSAQCNQFDPNYIECVKFQAIKAFDLAVEEAAKSKAREAIGVAENLIAVGLVQTNTQAQIQTLDIKIMQADLEKSQAAKYEQNQARQALEQAQQKLDLAAQELNTALNIAATTVQIPNLSAVYAAQTSVAEYTAQAVQHAQLAAQQYAYAMGQATSTNPSVPTWYMDYDGDGWHSSSQEKSRPPGAFGWKSTTKGIDCNDKDATKTYNCSDALPMITWFLDNDGDGYHAAGQMAATSPGPGWTDTMSKGPDCNDNDPSKTTGCSLVGAVTPTPDPKTKWYYDGDGDGYVDGAIDPVEAENSPGAKWVKVTDGKDFDCDDTNPAIGNCKMETKDCTTDANTRGTSTTTLLNSPVLQMPLSEFRNSANLATGKPESGMSIEKLPDGMLVPYNYQLGTGTVSNATVATQATDKTIVAGVHTHTGGKEDGPSPQDIYHLMEGYKGNNNYKTDFNIAANGNEYALLVENSVNLLAFETAYPSSTNIEPATNEFMKGTALEKMYKNVQSVYYHKGFPKEDSHEMALVLVLESLNAGVKLLKKENSTTNFKELSVESYVDTNGKLLDVKIKKCN